MENCRIVEMLVGKELWAQPVRPLAWSRVAVSARSGQPWLWAATSGNLSLQLEGGPLILSPYCTQGYSRASWVASEPCWPPLPFPHRPSGQLAALQPYSWATATQAYVSPNQTAPIKLYYSFRAWISLFSCIMEFCAVLWVFFVIPKLKSRAQVFWNTEERQDGCLWMRRVCLYMPQAFLSVTCSRQDLIRRLNLAQNANRIYQRWALVNTENKMAESWQDPG